MKDIFARYNIPYDEKKEQLLMQYMELVLQRNQHINLTAITNREEFIERHYEDSLTVAMLPEFVGARKVMDLGTGGGFPGVPLAIAFLEKDFVLVDSLNKRIKIIQEFCDQLGIGNVTAIHGRAEELGRDPALRDQFDAVLSRAVADLRVLSEYCLPFVKVGGSFIAYKGADCEAEVAEAAYSIETLGGSPLKIVNSDAGGGEGHKLVLSRKIKETPSMYPRRAGKPVKSPLRASK